MASVGIQAVPLSLGRRDGMRESLIKPEIAAAGLVMNFLHRR